MALYVDEEEIFKCKKHPKHRRTGICPKCLRERLLSLCPDCANLRPCACYPTTNSSSSASSSFPLFSSSYAPKSGTGSDGEPSFRRSRSLAFPFLRQKTVNRDTGAGLPPLGNGSKSSVWSVFKTSKVKKEEGEVKMMRSKSVAVSAYSDSGSDVRSKERRWYFQSPMNIFRQPKTAKVVQDRSPLYRR